MSQGESRELPGQISESLAASHPEVAAMIAKVALSKEALVKKSRDMLAVRSRANSLGEEAGMLTRQLNGDRGELFSSLEHAVNFGGLSLGQLREALSALGVPLAYRATRFLNTTYPQLAIGQHILTYNPEGNGTFVGGKLQKPPELSLWLDGDETALRAMLALANDGEESRNMLVTDYEKDSATAHIGLEQIAAFAREWTEDRPDGLNCGEFYMAIRGMSVPPEIVDRLRRKFLRHWQAESVLGADIRVSSEVLAQFYFDEDISRDFLGSLKLLREVDGDSYQALVDRVAVATAVWPGEMFQRDTRPYHRDQLIRVIAQLEGKRITTYKDLLLQTLSVIEYGQRVLRRASAQ